MTFTAAEPAQNWAEKGLAVEIVPFETERHLEKVARFSARTCGASEAVFRRELLKLYSRLPSGFFVAVTRENREPVGFISMGFLKPRAVRFLIGWLGVIFPRAVEPVVGKLVKLGVVSNFEVANIIVDEGFQRKGIGTKLMFFGETFAEQRFAQERVSLYVRENNDPALGLYKKIGYKQVGFFFLGGRKKLVMVKTLAGRGRLAFPAPFAWPGSSFEGA